MAEDDSHDHDTPTNGTRSKRPSKIRDLFTDRIVGIISGAFIPLVLLFIPLINKYLDNTKEIQTLQIQNNTEDIESTNKRVEILTQALVGSQIQLTGINEKFTQSVVELKKVTHNLEECQKNCDPYCQSLSKKRAIP